MEHYLAGEQLSHARAVAGLVEQFGGLGIGVVVEELVQKCESLRVGLAGLPSRRRDRDREARRLPAAETYVKVDLVGLVDRDVFDGEAGHTFAFPLGGGRVGPQPREVAGQGTDPGFCSSVKAPLAVELARS